MGITLAAITCLAMNVFHEARGESVKGQIAVAAVTVNRAKQNGSDVCTEVYKPKQFSWTNGMHIINRKVVGKKVMLTKKPNPKWVKRYKIDPKDESWSIAVSVAQYVLTHKPKIVKDATFYHATYVKPKWSKSMVKVSQIGQHIFYTKA